MSITFVTRSPDDLDHRPGRSASRGRWIPKVIIAAVDVVAIAAAMAAAFLLRWALDSAPRPYAAHNHLVLGLLSLPVWLALFAHYDLYRGRQVASRLEEFRRIVYASVAGSVATMVLSVMVMKKDFSRGWLAGSVVLAVLLVTVERAVVRRVFRALRRGGKMLRPVVVVGANTEGTTLCSLLTSEPALGYKVLGCVDDCAEVGSSLVPGVPVLGKVADVVDVVRQAGATGVIVASSVIGLETSNRLARKLSEIGAHVELSAVLKDISVDRLHVRPLGRYSVVHVEPVVLLGWRSAVKRTFDIVLATSMLVLTSPILLVAAVAIKVNSRRDPVLFRQERVGRGGQIFNILKLRTMVNGAHKQRGDMADKNHAPLPLFKVRRDPRVTSVGRLLRRFSIDELPQLWNVLRGDMSIVGPRPALADEMSGWSEDLHNRLKVRPGITGMWQVNGRSDCLSFEDYTRWDLYYVDNWSLWTDLTIIVKTMPVVLRKKGAY